MKPVACVHLKNMDSIKTKGKGANYFNS